MLGSKGWKLWENFFEFDQLRGHYPIKALTPKIWLLILLSGCRAFLIIDENLSDRFEYSYYLFAGYHKDIREKLYFNLFSELRV